MLVRRRCLAWMLLAMVLPFTARPVRAQEPSAEEMNRSNSPLNPAPAFNLQNYWSPSLYDVDRYTNDFLPRVSKTLPPGLVPRPQLFRLTVPISTRPNGTGTTTGLGDINLFDIILLGSRGGMSYGVGPLITAPSASDDVLGTGKWLAGLALIGLHARPRGLLGGLIQWQTSFAGDDLRADVSSLTVQPLIIHNLSKGLCLRSTAIWTFDLENDHYFIPIGLGVGKVKKSGTKTMNFVLEPQVTVAHDGAGYPKFTLFAAINTQFGK